MIVTYDVVVRSGNAEMGVIVRGEEIVGGISKVVNCEEEGGDEGNAGGIDIGAFMACGFCIYALADSLSG